MYYRTREKDGRVYSERLRSVPKADKTGLRLVRGKEGQVRIHVFGADGKDLGRWKKRGASSRPAPETRPAAVVPKDAGGSG